MWKPCPAAAGAHSFIMYGGVSVRARAHVQFGNVACGASLDTHAHAQRRAWIVRSVGELRCRAAAADAVVVAVTVRGGRGPGCLWCSGSKPPTEPIERLDFLFLDTFLVDYSFFYRFVMGTSIFLYSFVIVVVFRAPWPTDPLPCDWNALALSTNTLDSRGVEEHENSKQ